MGLSRSGSLNSRSLSMACAPENLGEGGKQCLLWFWPAGLGAIGSEVVPKTQQENRCFSRTKVNELQTPERQGCRHLNSSHIFLITMRNG